MMSSNNIIDKINEETTEIIKKIHQHPFNQDLLKGSLEKKTFQYFLEQDSIYLKVYSKLLIQIHIRLDSSPDGKEFKQFSAEAKAMLEGYHLTKLPSHSLTLFQSKKIELNSAVQAYIDHLTDTVKNLSIEEAISAVAPCYLIYYKLAKTMSKSGENKVDDTHPYQDWIKSYSGEEFFESAKKFAAIVNKFAESATKDLQDKMVKAYVKSAELELALWDSVYPNNKEEKDTQINDIKLIRT
jgi:thiaminase/transcriptional activator TenA